MEREGRNLISTAVVMFWMVNLCNAGLDLTYVDPTTEFAIAANSGRQSEPAIWGDWVAWCERRGTDGGYDIYAENLSTNEEIKLTGPSSSAASYPDIYDGLVVWNDWRNGDSDIYQYDLRTRTESILYSGPGEQVWPAIYGDTVVWAYRDSMPGVPEEVWGYSISEDEAFLISDSEGYKWYPDISGDIVVWGDFRNGNWDIYGYDLSAHTELEIASGPEYQRSAAVHGDRVAYEHGNQGIGIYDLDSGTRMIHESQGANDNIAIYGEIIVWGSMRGGRGPDTDRTYNIYGYNAVGDEEFPICVSPGDQGGPAIYENIVVWSDGRLGGWWEADIYGNTVVPEPASILLVSFGGLVLLRKRS